MPTLRPLKSMEVEVGDTTNAGFGKGVFPLSTKPCRRLHSQFSPELCNR